jgi:hypothetical protein
MVRRLDSVTPPRSLITTLGALYFSYGLFYQLVDEMLTISLKGTLRHESNKYLGALGASPLHLTA